MPIDFAVNHDDGYVLATYTGRITDEELFSLWKAFYESEEWFPGLNELSDVRAADVSDITASGLRRVSNYCNEFFSKRGVETVRIALCASGQLTYGLARMYEAFSNGTPEFAQVFEDIDKAKAWLRSPSEDE